MIAPWGREAALKSPLYNAPKAAKARCRLPAFRTGGLASMRRYGKAMSSCLDGIWARDFKAAKLWFVPPRAVFVPRRVKDRVCGQMPMKGAGGTYCGRARKYWVLLEPSDAYRGQEAWVAEVIAHEYGHHIQYLMNITDYEHAAWYDAKTPKVKDALSRRLELQAECLAGVALKAMGGAVPSLWEFRTLYQGTLDAQWVRDHGRLATQLRWFERGYRAGGPKVCNTWKAPGRDVT
ncbi:neutral zinc metallopeptidase [Sphaerisporangium sp. NPDC051017]|uniref:neutral zinc metallopeptidase n=1 Tax=Sphaerisporangium sp. NPDC051017 TaxID=3154636 RepID=UPI003430BB7C